MKKRLFFSLFACLFAVAALLIILPGCSKETAGVKLKVALGRGPMQIIDPHAWGGGSGATYYNVHEPLIGFDAKNKMTGILADSWSFSDDGKELTMKLKKGVKFSDGTELKSKDVVFSLDRSRKTNFAVIDQLNAKVFDRYEAADDYTVKFYFPKVNVQFLPQTLSFTMITSKDQFDKSEKEYAKNPVGTGPYKVTDWKEGQYVNVVYNDQFRGKKPQIAEAQFVFAPDNATRINMLRAGEVNLINDVDWKSVKSIQDEGFKRYDVVSPHDAAIQFQLFNPKTPWANKKVRQAVNYMIDKKAIIDKLFGGVPTEGVWQCSWELGYDSSLKGAYPFNPEKAKQLMKEAGFEKGFDMPLSYLADASWAKDVVDVISSSLKQINITIKPKGITGFPNFMDECRKAGQKRDSVITLLFDYGWPGNPEPVINLTNGFWSGKANSLWSTPETDALIEKALGTLDNKERGKLVNQAYKIINDELPFVPIFLEADVHMMSKNVTYKPSMGDMNNTPSNLFDLTVE